VSMAAIRRLAAIAANRSRRAVKVNMSATPTKAVFACI
jgi:hypothetical protein